MSWYEEDTLRTILAFETVTVSPLEAPAGHRQTFRAPSVAAVIDETRRLKYPGKPSSISSFHRKTCAFLLTPTH